MPSGSRQELPRHEGRYQKNNRLLAFQGLGSELGIPGEKVCKFSKLVS